MTITTINTLEADLGFASDAYRLVKKIGQGGFGQVYLAKQLNTNQDVAIKFLSVSNDFDEAKKKRYIERFDRETLLCSRLQHPNIVRLLDKGCCHDNLLYAVFEYVDGKTLRETLADSGALLPLEAAEVMGQVLDALAHAHEQGVIHRDVKPANIMLTKVGAKIHAKVLDFGIGTLVNEVRQLDYKSITLTQETLGTPSYSAPEQLRGEPPTPKTDIYVWGLVFIECLTGQAAISGTSLASVFHKQLSQSNVPLPASLAGHTVSGLLRRVLNKNARDRAADAAELYHEFHQLNFATLVGGGNQVINSSQANEKTLVVQPGDNETLINQTLINDSSLLQQSTYASLTERKQITALAVVLNIKAVDDQDLDGEVVDAIHRDQKAQCVDIAIRYGAFHVGTLANTLLFYFGYPSVSDNDSRLCARTALEISSKLSQRSSLLKPKQGIEILPQMGLHTGVVTTYTDTIPEGDSANIAMALARLAKSNQILVSQNSKALLDSYLNFQMQPAKSLGIRTEAISLYSLIGERQVEAFGFLRGNKHNHDFIGREQELAALGQLLKPRLTAEDTHNHSRAAHVFGEAGIGKSRLVFELRNLARRFTHYVTQCLPEHNNNALYPILNLVKFKYSLDALSPELAVAKLKQVLERLDQQSAGKAHNVQDALAILCSWLALPVSEDISLTVYPPDVQKQILFQVLISLLLTENNSGSYAYEEQQAVLFLFEDLHWADPTSIEFIATLTAQNCDSDRIFISTSRRPAPKSLIESGYQALELSKLSPDKTTKFVINLFDKQKVSARLLDVVVSRTDGIPLFIEELVNMLKQKCLVHHLNGITDFVNPDNINDVPTSLRDSLQQKLDTLVYAKETAQLASSIGREFDYNLLAAASNHSEAQLQIDLKELIESDLLILQRKVAGDSYIFKHALVRDAAYESMLKELRVAAHKAVAVALEAYFAKYVADNPMVVARHFAGALENEKAVTYGIKAISKQVANSTNDEAVAMGDITLKWLEDIPVKEQQIRLELQVHDVMLPAVMTLYGYGAERVSALGYRIKALIEQTKVYSSLFENAEYIEELLDKSEWALFLAAHYCSRRAEARELGEKLLKRARENNNRQHEMVVLVHLSQAYYVDGDLDLSAEVYENALLMHDDEIDADIALEYGTDTKAQNLSLSAETYLNLGLTDTAYRKLYQSLEYAEKIGHQGSIIFAHVIIGQVAAFLKDHEKVIEITQRYENKYGKEGAFFHLHYLYVYYYCATCEVDLARHALDQQFNSGQLFATGWYVTHLAEAYLKVGEVKLAVELMEASLEKSLKYKEKASYPFIKRTLAQCYYTLDEQLTPRVKALLLAAIADAVEQNAKYFELEARVYYVQKLHAELLPAEQDILELTSLINKMPEGHSTLLYQQALDLVNVQNN